MLCSVLWASASVGSTTYKNNRFLSLFRFSNSILLQHYPLQPADTTLARYSWPCHDPPSLNPPSDISSKLPPRPLHPLCHIVNRQWPRGFQATSLFPRQECHMRPVECMSHSHRAEEKSCGTNSDHANCRSAAGHSDEKTAEPKQRSHACILSSWFDRWSLDKTSGDWPRLQARCTSLQKASDSIPFGPTTPSKFSFVIFPLTRFPLLSTSLDDSMIPMSSFWDFVDDEENQCTVWVERKRTDTVDLRLASANWFLRQLTKPPTGLSIITYIGIVSEP